MNSCRSDIDIPFRYGGDEFGIILPGINRTEAASVAERIQVKYAEIAPPVTSLSIGIAFQDYSHSGQQMAAEELIRAADECVYMAKRKGRNSIIIEQSPEKITH